MGLGTISCDFHGVCMGQSHRAEGVMLGRPARSSSTKASSSVPQETENLTPRALGRSAGGEGRVEGSSGFGRTVA